MKIAMLEDKIERKLLQYGFSQGLKGYRYLVAAIIFSIQDMELSYELTKGLYPKVAEQYFTTAECVERSMRHAIEKAWKASSEYGFGMSLDFSRKPSNGNFIRCVSNYINKEEILSWGSERIAWTNRYQRC